MDKASMLMTRSQVAKELHLHPETLRYYELQKIIKKPLRQNNNYRVYNKNDIAKLKFIVAAKQLGFSLKEIKELLALSVTEKSDRAKVKAIAKAKSALIEDKMQQLSKMKNALDKMISICNNDQASAYCPILYGLYERS